MSDNQQKTNYKNPIFGRQVFFLLPPYNVQNVVLGKLRDMEYEVYHVPNYSLCKPLLRHHPDAVCFINIDDETFSYEGWKKYIKSFENDAEFENLILGIFSSSNKKADKNMFLLDSKLEAGWISTSVGTTELTNSIKDVLEVYGAKGRRQYVRAFTGDDKNAIAIIRMDNKMFTFQILDISSVGMACEVPLSVTKYLQVNSVLKNFTITVGVRQIIVSAMIFAIKQESDKAVVVLLFLPGMPDKDKTLIRDYILTLLNKKIFKEILEDPLDEVNYEVLE